MKSPSSSKTPTTRPRRVIRRVMAEHPAAAARLLVAGRATESGQKVHNLRAATADCRRRSATWSSSIPMPSRGPSGCGR